MSEQAYREASGARMWERAAYMARRLERRMGERVGLCFAIALHCTCSASDRLVTRQAIARVHWVWRFRLSPFRKVSRLASSERYTARLVEKP